MLKIPTGARRHIGAALAIAGVMTLVAGCSDNCTGVDCGPVPPALQAVVLDTVQVDTVVYVDSLQQNVTMTIRRLGPVTDAVVTLAHVVGADTLDFDTLDASGGEYQRLTIAGLPSDSSFVLQARRGGKFARATDLKIRHVSGCCSYDVIGRYTLIVRSR